MSDYITNSKNRKLKTNILWFLSRINIGAGKLPISGQVILLMEAALLISLFFPWMQLTDINSVVHAHTAFSGYMAYIGYGIIVGLILIPFFLLSHTKKERLRAGLPFRLSDAQAVAFITSILLVSIVEILIITRSVYNVQIAAQWATMQIGFKIAITAIIFILLATYFFSKSNKTSNTQAYYIDHHTDDELQEYQDILGENDAKKKKNMSLPI